MIQKPQSDNNLQNNVTSISLQEHMERTITASRERMVASHLHAQIGTGQITLMQKPQDLAIKTGLVVYIGPVIPCAAHVAIEDQITSL